MRGMDALHNAVKDHHDTRDLFVEKARSQADQVAVVVGQARDLVDGYTVQPDQSGFVLGVQKKTTKTWNYDDAVKFANDVKNGLLEKVAGIYTNLADSDRNLGQILDGGPTQAPTSRPAAAVPAPREAKPEPKDGEYYCLECHQTYPPSHPLKDCPSCGGLNSVIRQPGGL